MTAVLPISAEPAAVPQEEAKPGRWRRMPAKAKAGAFLLGLFVLAAIIGPLVTPYDPSYQNPLPSLSLHAPDGAHLLGTTQSGQDVLSQLLVGIRLTLELAFLVGAVATELAVLVGVSAAFLGGAWDELLSLLTNVFLVIPALPKAIWSTAGNPSTYADVNPVGTGPYKLGSFTPQGYTLVKNPYYWRASSVKVPKVYFPVYTSNTGALSALFAGQIDWTGNFIPGLQKSFVGTNPNYHHYWEAPGGTNSLMPNLTKWPTNQLAVRQAISAAIDRTVLASEAEAGLENPVLNSTGLTTPLYDAWSAPVASMTVSAHADAAAAKQILQKAGYTMGSNGFFQKDGKTVSLTIVDPSAYTDYAEVDSIVAQELRAAGIDATFQGLSVDAWNSDVADGNFQLTSHWSNGGITPYNMYDGWLDSSLATGNAATGDYERLNDPSVQTMLATLAGAETTAQQTAALAPIAKYVAANLPIIPTTTASQWFEYNSQNYTGWPTQDNPYETGQPSGTNNGPGSGTDEVVILHLTPRS